MNEALVKTNFNFEGQTSFYKGKVRDVYTINDDILVMIVSDRISAFDVVLPEGIPHKGQVLNQIASMFLDNTTDIVKNWKISSPDPMVTIGRKVEPFMVEMVVRGFLTGHAWREYKEGKRELCGVKLPEGLKEHDRFEKPIITPTTKAMEGHDEDISREEIIKKGIVPEDKYIMLEKYALGLFQRGTEEAKKRGLLLVDTKYEFGEKEGEIYLMDEIHTPDSSRYFYADGYEDRQKNGEKQKQLSKEFVREWLIANGFQGQEGQKVPEMNAEFVKSVSERYIELFEKITGETFVKENANQLEDRIKNNIETELKKLI